MRIGVWIEDVEATCGGGASYEQHVLNLIDEYDFSKHLDIVFVTENSVHHGHFAKALLTINYPKPDHSQYILKILTSFLPTFPVNLKRYFLSRINRVRQIQLDTYLEQLLKRNRVDIIYYPIQQFCRLPDYPFIATNWDIGHRSTYAFPEFHEKDKSHHRNKWYNHILPKALLVLTESKTGLNELIRYTSIGEHKIRVVPLIPGKCIYFKADKSIIEKYGLFSKRFFFYPAQFWPHKNHVVLIEAFAQVACDYPDIKLLLSGSDKGTLPFVRKYVDKLNLLDKVLFPGFVNEKEIASFYEHALALVMPTYLGPTNIPLLEARGFKCPIICSNLPGHKEILGPDAIYFPPNDVDKLSQAMRMVLNGKLNSRNLNDVSQTKTQSIFTTQNFIVCLEKAFEDAIVIRKCWN